MTDFTVNERVINFVQQCQGFTLTCNQIKAICEGSSHAPRMFNGCIQSLSYSQSQELEQVILSIDEASIRRQIVLTCRADVRESDITIDTRESDLIIKVDNVNHFERVLKNAIDFGHQPCIIIEGCTIIWCTLLPFRCRPGDLLPQIAFSGGPAKDSPKPPR